MYPNLLSIFDIHLQGVVFERTLWVFGFLLMIWGLASSIAIWRRGKRKEASIQGVIVTAIGSWFAVKLIQTFIQPYVPVFSEEIIIHTYAFCILIGVILGFIIAIRLGKREGLSVDSTFNLLLALVIFGFLGARLLFILVEGHEYFTACFHPEELGLAHSDCFGFFRMTDGGLAFYGGVISGFIVLLVNQRKNKVSILKQVDFLTPSLCISHAFGRIGCLAAGCCWGEVTTGSLGVSYPKDSFAYMELLNDQMQTGNSIYSDALAQGHTPLMHATQLLEASGEFMIFFFVLWLFNHRKKLGSVFASWMLMYGVWRFFTECLRGDVERGFLFEAKISWLNNLLAMPETHVTMFSTSQTVATGMIICSLCYFMLRSKVNLKSEVSALP